MSASAVPLAVAVAGCAALVTGCASGDDPGHPGGPKGFGPMPSQVLRLVEKPIVDFDEYLASITSRHSINLYPQVVGYIRSLHVHPGEAVKTNALLVEIDPGQTQATLRSLDANLQTKKANLAYAIQNDNSSHELLKAGLLGQLDYEQRHSQRLSAESDVRAAEEQVKAQGELLRFYSIRAPNDGVVGDVPVKIGEYVTPQTRLTSVDQDKFVETYVYVPVTKSSLIRADTQIKLLGEDGQTLCQSTPFFISPQVSIDTQTVLVKTLCPNPGSLRSAQVLKARIQWSVHKGITIPVTAATRQSGQYFAFIVESTAKGTVARQRPIEVGRIEGNSFVVTKGLTAGDELLTSNIQKIRDGAPIAPQVSTPKAATATAAESH